MQVLALPEFREYFKELSLILYEKDYFGFEESALEYVDSLFNDIERNLPNYPKKVASAYFAHYGENMYYAIFRKSKSTQWYVFFTIYIDQGETIYLVRYISNNHVISQYL